MVVLVALVGVAVGAEETEEEAMMMNLSNEELL